MEPKQIIDFINSNDINARDRFHEDTEKYLMYSGRLREIIYQIIESEFENKKTVQQLKERIVPINIIRKITDKLGKVYKDTPIREPQDRNPADMDLIAKYENIFDINTYMQYANKLTKLHKQTLLEIYLKKNGIPAVRPVPSQCFSLFSDDEVNPEIPTTVVKHILFDKDKKKERHIVWTNDQHYVMDGEGLILRRNVDDDLINPFGVIPYVHINESLDMLYPLRPTDITSVQKAICLVLSDATLAQKYLSWGTLVIAGTDGEKKVQVGPGATITLPKQEDGTIPTASYVQPKLNVEEVLKLVKEELEYLLATNNLKAGTVLQSADTSTAASGFSKMLDSVESTEDVQEQRTLYIKAEKELWNKFAHSMLPVWVKNGEIDPEYKGAFSPDFDLNIRFKEYVPMMSEMDRVRLAKEKLQNGFVTLKMALKEINPDATDESIDELMSDLETESKKGMEQLKSMNADSE